jgi:signal transduction histidine kinase
MRTRKTPSFARQLQRAYWWFGGFMVLLFGVLSFEESTRQEDSLLRLQTRLAFADYLNRNPTVLEGAEPPAVETSWFSVHGSVEGLPAQYRDYARDLPAGIHELGEGLLGKEDYFVRILDLTDGERLYFLYDVREIDAIDESRHARRLVFAVGGGIILLTGIFVVATWSRRFVAPFSTLAEIVQAAEDPSELAEALSYKAEVGGGAHEVEELRESLVRSMRRIDRFVQRERQFSRNASHELRTPLAVIRGATELLAREVKEPRSRDQLRRIQRAEAEMEELVQTFLYLAREELPLESDSSTDVEAVARSVVEQNRHLLREPEVAVEIRFAEPVILEVPHRVISILLSNLVRNAFQSTLEGSVEIIGSPEHVQVLDTGPGIALPRSARSDTDRDQGFGLQIVKDLCQRIGWQLRLSNRSGKGTVAELSWPGDAAFVPDRLRAPDTGKRS